MGIDPATRIRHVTAVLGPTNTGKTHLAIERMLDHETGMIGLPLRLLAREIYDKVTARVGVGNVALITGEEKIKPEGARYWICTVEAMPRDIAVDFMAIDEIQLAADPERGHVFTDRLLNMRGQLETLVLGAGTMREAITELIPGSNFISRPRLSKLTYTGQKKITRLPARSAIVAFSANDVYAIAELIRRQRGGAAVVLGALSPRTRNAQVALYQSGDVDFLVATDAVGMGLNLDVDHVAFSAIRKFDGYTHRNLTPAELGQIAGRAGRHLNDGTFGVTSDVEPFDGELVERLESHVFEPVKVLQWRSPDVSFASLDALRDSLRQFPNIPRLARARMADDVEALENVANDRDVVAAASSPAAVAKLWEVCQIPDYRKISSQNHAELVARIYGNLMSSDGVVDEDWFSKQVAYSDRTDGDIDTLSNRLAHIRTWTFVANRADWLKDPEHWQERTRKIEDSLSDALHERLTQRFVDARTSALMKGLKANDDLAAEIGEDGAIQVENHYVGRLQGFLFALDADADGVHQKAARHAAVQILSKELSMRVRRVVAAKDAAFKLTLDGKILWRDEEIGRLDPGEDPLKPLVVVLSDENLSIADRDRVQERLATWINTLIKERLKPLADLAAADDIAGLARGIAFRLSENLGVLRREAAAAEIKSLDQSARAQLRRFGLRFGAFNLFFPVLLKPAAAELLLTLWCLKYAEGAGLDRRALPQPPRAGLTSVATDPAVPEAFYQAIGFHVCGPRAVRIDILERLADLIRPLLGWRASEDKPVPPRGATGDGAFTVTPEMMSILGCSPEELGHVLRALGFRSETRRVPVEVPTAAVAPAEAEEAAFNEEAGSGETAAQVESEQSEAGAGDGASGAATEAAAGDAAIAVPTDDQAVDVVEAEPPTEAVPAAVDATAVDHSEVSEPSMEASAEAAVLDQGMGAAVQDAAVAVAPVAAEPVAVPEVVETEREIEVWRPRRRQEENRRGRGQRRRHGAGGDARPGQGADKGSDTGPARGDAGQEAAPADGRAGDGGGRNAGRSGRNRGDRRDGKHGSGADRRDDRPQGRPRGDRRDDKRGGNRSGGDRQRTRVHSSAPAKSSGVDPDSPFAALSVLKQALDKRDQGS